MKRRKRRARHAGRRDAFHLTMITVLMTVLCLMIVNIKEPEQTEEEQPETTHAEVVQNPGNNRADSRGDQESKYKVFDGMSEDWGSDDLEGFVLYKLPEQYADKGYFPEKMQIYTRCLCKQNDVPYALVVAIIEHESGYEFDKVGDGGQSKGYMQIYEKWHTDRMKRLSCTDLMNPYQNVRVGIVSCRTCSKNTARCRMHLQRTTTVKRVRGNICGAMACMSIHTTVQSCRE